jgi:predicted Zn-dependent protease
LLLLSFDSYDATTSAVKNLFHIAIHEIGHALGIDHQSDKMSVMYPYYPEPYERSRVNYLTVIDQESLQAIYGKRKTSMR